MNMSNEITEGGWGQKETPPSKGQDSPCRALPPRPQSHSTTVCLQGSPRPAFTQPCPSANLPPFEPNSLISLWFLSPAVRPDPVLGAWPLGKHLAFYHDFCRWLIARIISLLQLSEGNLSKFQGHLTVVSNIPPIMYGRVKQWYRYCSSQIHPESAVLLLSTMFVLIVSVCNQPWLTLHHVKRRNASYRKPSEGSPRAPENLFIHPCQAQKLLSRKADLSSTTSSKCIPKSETDGYISLQRSRQKTFLFDTAVIETRPCFCFIKLLRIIH